MMSLKEEIKERLIVKKMTKKALVDALEMSYTGFDQMIENETISIKKLRLLVDILEIDVLKLFEVRVNGNGNTVQMGGRDVTNGQSSAQVELLTKENEGLKKEVELLREMVGMLKSRG